MALVTVPTIFRSVRRVTEPQVEPVSLYECKEHLRLMPDFSDDDSYIIALIAAARRMTEDRVNRTWTLTQWQATFSHWHGCGCRGRELPRPPLMATIDTYKVEIRFRNADGFEEHVDAGNIRANVDEFPGRVHLSETLSSECCQQEGVVTWWAGVELPQDVPAQAKVAIKLLVAHWYGNRSAVTTDGVGTELPLGVDSLLASLAWGGGY